MKKFDIKKIGLNVAGLGAGAVAANAAVKFLPATMDNKIVSAIQIVAGAVIPEMLGKKSELITSVGNGIIAVGAMNLISTLTAPKAVTGIFGDYMTDSRIMGEENEMNETY
ncbi:MAG: hypothetical protein WCO13_00705 [Bacteroidota bacterium]